MDSKFIKSNDVRVKKYFCMVRKVLCLPSPKNLKVMLIFSPPPSFYPTRFYFPYPNLGYVGRKKRRERNMQIYKLIKLWQYVSNFQKKWPIKTVTTQNKQKNAMRFTWVVHDSGSRLVPIIHRQDRATVHLRIPSDYNTVCTFHTKTVSYPTNSTLLCLCNKALLKSWLAKPSMDSTIMKHEPDTAASKKDTPKMPKEWIWPDKAASEKVTMTSHDNRHASSDQNY